MPAANPCVETMSRAVSSQCHLVGAILRGYQVHPTPTKHSSCAEFPRPGLKGQGGSWVWVIGLITVNDIPFIVFIWCLLTVCCWKISPSFQQLQPMHFSLVLLIFNVLGDPM